MKQYSELTKLGKIRRLRKVVLLALEKYDIDVNKFEYLTEATNIFFKLTDKNGIRFAIKIFQEESSKIEDNLAEVYFIKQVQKNSDIIVPNVVKSKDNEYIISIDSKYTDITKRIAIYEWIEGYDLDGHESNERFYQLGQMCAKLHNATKSLTLPNNIHPKKWDKVFYYRDEKPVYKEKKYQQFLNDNYHKVMDFIIPYLNNKLNEFYDNVQPQLIHADLNPFNVKILKDEMRIIDFEEAMYGTPLQDFSIMLFYYRYDKNFNYEEVKKYFFDGYSSINQLPIFSEYDIELFINARTANFLNYALLIFDNPTEYVNRNIPRVEAFIEKYAKKEYELYELYKSNS